MQPAFHFLNGYMSGCAGDSCHAFPLWLEISPPYSITGRELVSVISAEPQRFEPVVVMSD